MTADPSIPVTGLRSRSGWRRAAGLRLPQPDAEQLGTNGGEDGHFQVESNGTGPGLDPDRSTRPLRHRPELRLTGEAFASWNPANDTYALSLVGDFLWQATIAIDGPLINTRTS